MQGLSLGRIDLDEPRGGKIEILGQILGADAKEIRETAWRGRSGVVSKDLNPERIRGSQLARLERTVV